MNVDEIKQCVEAVETYGSQRKAAEALGYSLSSFRRRLEKAARTGNDGLAVMRVPFGHNVKGISTQYDADGNVKSQWIKTKTDQPDIEDLVEYFKDAFQDIQYFSDYSEQLEETVSNKVTVYPIADLHIGMLAWGEETGDDYDLKIARETILTNFQKLVNKSEPTEECLIINLGDAVHINDSKNATPRGNNLLDVDSRYEKIIEAAVDIFVNMIDIALAKHGKITWRNVKGNHDHDSIVALNVALKMFSNNNSRVTIDMRKTQLVCYEYGVNLIGCYHGHTMKPQAAYNAMTVDYKEEFGRSKFSHLLYGHIHHETVVEIAETSVESFSTISAKDAYAADYGYRSKRRLTSITYDYDHGMIDRSFVNLL